MAKISCLVTFTVVIWCCLYRPALSADADAARAFSRDCSKGYSTTCLKLDVVSFVEKLSENDDYAILPGVSVVREPNSSSETRTADLVAELARDFPDDAEARLDAFLVKKVEGFLNTHSIRLRLLDAQSVQAARAFVQEGARKGGIGGGGGKKGGMGGALMAGMMMMKGTLMSIGMGAVALLAGKALMTGLLALMLSAIIGLKALTSGGHKQTTYEIVSKPVYSHSHSHSSSHEDSHGGGGGGYGGYGHGRSMQQIPDGFPDSLLTGPSVH